MKKLGIGLSDVQKVYSGPEGALWKLVLGEQIHIGGFAESMVMAQKAGVKEGDRVLDSTYCKYCTNDTTTHKCTPVFKRRQGTKQLILKRQMNRLPRFSFQEAIGEKLVVNKREIIEVQGSIFLRGDGQGRGHPGTLNRETQQYKD